MQKHDIQTLVSSLRLLPHPEGGWFSEVYRSQETVDAAALPARYGSARCFATSIYFLLTSNEFSAFHRLKSDEIWHFYAGGRVVVVTIDERGNRKDIVLGSDTAAGECFQAVVPAGHWFGSYVPDHDSFALCGCTVAPGFEFLDFELAKHADLIRRFPQHADIINRLTR